MMTMPTKRLNFKSAAALWRQDRWKPIVAGAVNLAMNISFVICLPPAYKLDGVIFASVASMALIQIPWESHVVFSVFFNSEQSAQYWRFQLRSAVLALVLCVLTWGSAALIPMYGVTGILVKGVVASAFAGGFLVVFFHRNVMDAIDAVRRKA